MSKYEANPEDPMAKFTKSRPKTSVKDPNSTIARVKEALSKGKYLSISFTSHLANKPCIYPWEPVIHKLTVN